MCLLIATIDPLLQVYPVQSEWTQRVRSVILIIFSHGFLQIRQTKRSKISLTP